MKIKNEQNLCKTKCSREREREREILQGFDLLFPFYTWLGVYSYMAPDLLKKYVFQPCW